MPQPLHTLARTIRQTLRHRTLILALTLPIISLAPAAANTPSQQEITELKAIVESKVDLRRKPDNRKQFYYWLIDENGKTIKELDESQVFNTSNALRQAVLQLRASADKTTASNAEQTSFTAAQPNTSDKFSEGLAWVWPPEGEPGYINEQGKQVIKNEDLVEGLPFSEGLAAVAIKTITTEIGGQKLPSPKKVRQWGFIDKTGHIAISPKYDAAQSFHHGLTGVARRQKWHFIDKSENKIGEEYDEVGSFTDNLAPVKIAESWGYLNTAGKLVLPARFEEANDFSEGLASVKSGGRYGFINPSGELAIKPSFQAIDHFSEGLCPVQTDSGKWGFIDKSGKQIIQPLYNKAQAFTSGRALVRVKGQLGYIDNEGKYIVEPKYDSAYPYSGHTAIVALRNWNHPLMRSALMHLHLEGLKLHTDKDDIYIPENLDDALKELDNMLPPAAKEDIKLIEKSEMINYHLGFGSSLRSAWGLWAGDRLAKYFKSIGINHPDDMSGKILNAYWDKLHAGK